ncbi:hypothetical protein EI94DRAFT_1752571 [Lactarius quietus]|nr:hypothetical protein EI94DRAFT_1752571 [Lactarius quietus]
MLHADGLFRAQCRDHVAARGCISTSPVPTVPCLFATTIRSSLAPERLGHIPRLCFHFFEMSPRPIIRRYTEFRHASSPSPAGGVPAVAIVAPIVIVICVLVVLTVLWRRRAERRRVAERERANTQQPVYSGVYIPTTTVDIGPVPPPSSFPLPPPPPTPSKSPGPEPEPARRPGSSRGSGRSRVDPVLPRIHIHRQVRFNSDDMLAPRRQRPRSAQQRAVLGLPLAPPPTQPLPPTPTSASAGAGIPIPSKERASGESKGSERSNGGAKRKVRPLPTPPAPNPPPPDLPIVLRPNRLEEPMLPMSEQEGDQQEAVFVAPLGWWRDRGSNSSAHLMPPPYTSPPYGTRSQT